MKACTRCEQTKSLEEFYAHPAGKFGRQSWCKVCLKTHSAARQRERLAAGDEDFMRERRERWSRWRRNNLRKVADVAASRRARIRDQFVEHVDREVLLERHHGICGICHAPVDPDDFHVDHIFPIALGGDHSYANTQPAHPDCNRRKGARVEADWKALSPQTVS